MEDNSMCCHVCGSISDILKRCTRCKTVLYCSRECQIKDWATHKELCHKESCNNLKTPRAAQQTNLVRCGSDSGLNEVPTAPVSAANCKTLEAETPKLPPSKSRPIITVKCQKERHKVTVDSKLSGEAVLQCIASEVRIPMDKLKLVCKGKIMTADIIDSFVKNKAIFQAIGEVSESEDGLDSGHVDCVMSKLGVERNDAVRALRETQGDVIDAILYLGNK